jgi:hypothetical protein
MAMGIVSFFKKVFTGETEDPELEVARAWHNIVVDEKQRGERERDDDKEPYDPWSEVDNLRRNFFLGSWASRKFRIIGEDKVKAELEALRRKREEKEGKGEEKPGEGGY